MSQARRLRYRNVVAGDLNAQVGRREDYDDENTLVAHGFGKRNARGDMLLQWCVLHDLVLGNTYFADSVNDAWTYRNGDLHLQNDYIIFDKPAFS